MKSLNRLRPGWLLIALMLAVAPAYAQNNDRTDPNDIPLEEQTEPIFSLKVTPQLLANGLDKLVEKQLSRMYGMDEFQTEEMRLLLREEVPRFMRKHQADLERLTTEWLEAISGDEPPTAEFAAEWAARFSPIVEDARGTIEHVGENMREFLNDDQQVMLDGYLAASDMATKSVQGRLYEFEQGHFDPDAHWLGGKPARKRGPEEMKALVKDVRQARREAMGLEEEEIVKDVAQRQAKRPLTERPQNLDPQDRQTDEEYDYAADENITDPAQPRPENPGQQPNAAKAPKHEWEIYVENFIKRYNLNQEQQQKANTYLRDALGSRERYLTSKGSELEKVQHLFKNAKHERELATAEKAYQNLNKPLDNMFERLKNKVEKLPTRWQRRAVAQTDSEKATLKPPKPTDAAKRPRP